jgi:creatinine amidohydrolase
MRLDQATWYEVRDRLADGAAIILPCGSTEQHGPIGLIGTDAICAEEIANRAGVLAGALVAPTLAYTPAAFNTAFPGTISISEDLFEQLAQQILAGLSDQGFARIYVLNGHGANLAPLRRAIAQVPPGAVRLRSWWDFETVNELRQELYGDWEGMHATPSEVAITQATTRIVLPQAGETPPRKLSPAYIKAHAEDRHGPPDEHRAAFPDGRVGSHSALARPEHGRDLLTRAAAAVAADIAEFQTTGQGPTNARTHP